MKKYLINKENRALLKEIEECLTLSVDEIGLNYDEITIEFEPVDGKICAFDEFGNREVFDNCDELFKNYKVRGKPFIETLDNIREIT